MRILTKSSIYFIVASLVVFLISGTIIYFMLQALVYEEVDDLLTEKKKLVIEELETHNSFERFIIPKDSSVVIGPQLNTVQDTNSVFSDTLIIPPYEDEDEPEPCRLLKFSITYANETRMITMRKSLIETDDLIEGIIFSLGVILIVMIIVLWLINYFGMKNLWLPFQKLLDQIRKFDFRSRRNFEAVETDITEFKELNEALIKMTGKLTNDYFSLREFSENASHEMQTPLAIIQSKLELLFQQGGQDEDRMKALSAAYQATNRLSRLHHDLNLITKIENGEYTQKDSLHIKELLENQIENFSDIIEMKNLKLEINMSADPVLQGNKYLLDILFSNLFNNAIKHNIEQGSIQVELTDSSFSISNSGAKPKIPTEILFERFRKSNPASDSTGLGLSIIKQICKIHGFDIHYTWQNNHHLILINF